MQSQRRAPYALGLFSLGVSLLFIAGSGQAQDADALVAQLSGRTPAPPRNPAQLAEAYGQAVDHLLAGMSGNQGAERYNNQIALQYLAAHASRPNAEVERRQLALVLDRAVARPGLDNETRHWIVLQLERMGGAESIATLEACLGSEDAHLRDVARRALEKNADAGAAAAVLVRALKGAGDSRTRIGLLSSLGQMRTPVALEAIVPLIQSDDVALAHAAAQALGAIGSEAALSALVETLEKAREGLDGEIARVLVQAARAALPSERQTAARLYGSVYDWAAGTDQTRLWSLQGAALNGLIVADPAAGMNRLNTLAARPGAQASRMAVQAARATGGPEAVWVVAKHMGSMEPAAQVQLLGLIEERPTAATPEIVDRIIALARDSEDDSVVLAAIAALAQSDSTGAAATLFELATGPRSAKQQGAQEALATMAGSSVQEMLVDRCASGPGEARATAMTLLGERMDPPARDLLFEYAKDGDPAVARAALKALTALVSGRDVAALVGIIETTTETPVRSEAAKTLRRALSNAADPGAAAALLVRRMQAASEPEVTLALMNLLNGVGGELALKTVVAAVGSPQAQEADQALRTLCDWPDGDACPHLLALAQDDNLSLAHHALAIRGLVRLIKQEGGPNMEDKTDLCIQILQCARQIEGRRLAVSALGTLPTQASIDRLLSLAQSGDLREEAALAALDIARATRRSDRNGSRELTRKIAEMEVSPDVTGQAQQLLQGRRRR